MDRLWYTPGIVHDFFTDDWLRTRIMDGKDTSAISRAESVMQLPAARKPDELVCRQSLSLRLFEHTPAE